MESALVLVCGHPVDAVAGPGSGLASGLSALGLRVDLMRVLDTAKAGCPVTQDFADRVANDPDVVDSDIVIAMGALPLGVIWNGRHLYECLGKRFYLYSLDAPIYDLSRVPGVAGFVEMAKHSPRLGVMSPDLDNSNLVNEIAKVPMSSYVPFGGTFRPLTHQERLPRVAVIGTMGTELAEVADDDAFEKIVLDAPPAIVDHPRLTEFAEVIERPGSPLNIVALARDFLGLSLDEIYTPEVFWYFCTIDAIQKRRRRKLAISQLRDLPVDFFGIGWEPFAEGFSDSRLMGRVSYFEIAELCQRYSVLLNFDPNWDHGLHDRVYTALGNGCRVVTNHSRALRDLNPPDSTAIAAYDANDPVAIPDIVQSLLRLPPLEPEQVHRFRRENSWFARADTFLAARSPALEVN